MSLSAYSTEIPAGPLVRMLRIAYWCFLIAGASALAYTSYVTGVAHGYQAAEIAAIENAPPPVQPAIESIRPMGGNGPAHRLVHLTEGEVIGELNVPRLGVKAIVVQGDSQSVLRRAVGHIPDTSLPGQLGNVVLAGHRDTFFRPLRGIRAGDFISLKTAGGNFQYQVQSTTIVAPSHTEVLRSSGDNMLTLITCFPFYYVGAAPDRFVVRARQIGPPPG
jgi:sortase A